MPARTLYLSEVCGGIEQEDAQAQPRWGCELARLLLEAVAEHGDANS